MPFTLGARDTDADWREIGDSQPFWGVLTQDRFRPENIDSDALISFYKSGVRYIENVAASFQHLTGKPLRVGSALDFGCGAGRLTEAMLAHADGVTGYDISPGMLEQARAHGTGDAYYTNELPAETFDWINSFIVFQHIPPERGMAILRQLLARLAPDGFISLHFTIYSDVTELALSTRRPMWLRHLRQRLRPLKLWLLPPRTGVMYMYDYDLNTLCEAFHKADIEQLNLIHINHDGHHGVRICGRRQAATGSNSPEIFR